MEVPGGGRRHAAPAFVLAPSSATLLTSEFCCRADGDRSAEGIEPATSDPDRRWGQQEQRRQSDSGLPSAHDDAQSLVHRKRHGTGGGGGVYDSGVYHSGVNDSGVNSHSGGDGGLCRPSALMTTTAGTHQQHRDQSHSDTPGVFTVTEGKHARLSCRVTGKPKPEIVWMKSGLPLRRGRRYVMYEDDAGGGGLFVLRVLFCRQEDNGFYTCSASNAIGQTFSAVQLVVNEPQLLFKSRLCDVEVRESGVATLECEVPSAGLLARWFLEDTPLAPGHKYGIEADGTKRRLVIRDVTADDDAVYVCETRGGSRTVAELSVKGRIVQKLPRVVEVRQGEGLTLAVEVEDSLVEGEWLRDGVVVATSTTMTTTTARGRTRTLEIARVALGDDCDVTFKAGESWTTCKVRVKVPTPRWPPSNFHVRRVSYSSVSLEWRAPPIDDGDDHDCVDAARYAVEMRARGDRAPSWVDVSGPGARTELTVGGLQTGAEFDFRVAAVGAQGGRGPFAELRGPVLVKGDVEVLSPLSDVHASHDDDATFTIQLSRPTPGQWLRDGVQISSAGAAVTTAAAAATAVDDGRHIVGHFGATHTLVVRRVGWRDDGAAIAFLAGGLRADAALYVTEGGGLFSRLLSVSFAFAIVAYLLGYLLGGGGGGAGGAGGGLLEGTPMDRLT